MKRSFLISIITAAFILGLILALQFRVTSAEDNATPRNRGEELALEKKQLVSDLLQLQEEIVDLSAKLDKAGEGQNEASEELEKELAKIKRYAGLTPVSGPGVELSVQSISRYAELGNADGNNITDEHLLKIINDLYSAGAEAIAINDRRLTVLSEIRLAGSHINVNGVPLSTPYRITAIGNATALKGRLEIKEGIVEYLSEFGVSVKVQVKENIVIPAFAGALNFEFAKPVN